MFSTPTKVDYRSEYTLIQCLDRETVPHIETGKTVDDGDCHNQEEIAKDIIVRNQTSDSILPKATELDISGTEMKCLAIEKILTQNECSQIIALAEESGLFKPALINAGFGQELYIPEARNSDRCIIDDLKFAEAIFERLKEFIPTTHTSSGISWKAVGLNERFRVLRYGEGHKFPWHQDGNYMRNSKERSYYTLMLYLNEGGDDFVGGSTLFQNVHQLASQRDDPKNIIKYRPKEGGAVIFNHRIPHEGEKVRKGVKYAIRTDVMYRIEDESTRSFGWQK